MLSSASLESTRASAAEDTPEERPTPLILRYRVGVGHGVATITRDERTALGVIFHDSK
jgi:hypothetical protein